jgi:glyoxylase-like metal-dependent hydrolase (beta-lactamase superfamily II)
VVRAALACAGLLSVFAWVVTPGSAQQPPPATAGDLRVLPVQGSVHMIAGAGANVAVQVGPEGVLVVDAGTGDAADRLVAAIRTLSDKSVRFVVNTHAHLDHTGGNLKLATLGEAGTAARSTDDAAPIIAHESVLARLSMPEAGQPSLPFEAWPNLTFTDKKEVFANGEAIEIFHREKAHTDGDSIVFFRRSDVVVTGDIFLTTTYPVIDPQHGAGINGVIAGLNQIIDIAIPRNTAEGGTQVIPGHGRLAEESDVVEYRDMVTIIRDRILHAVTSKQTLEQVKAARLTRDYDGRYGGTAAGPWNAERFVEAVYKDLSAQNAPPAAAPRRPARQTKGT